MKKRYLGVDLGTKKVGLAMSDPLNIIASAFDTIDWKGKKAFVNDVNKLIEEYNIGSIIFGLPLTLDGNESKKTLEIRELVEFFRTQFPEDLFIDFEDEAFTSEDAKTILRQMGKKPKDHRKRVDQIAAQLILTSYMETYL